MACYLPTAEACPSQVLVFTQKLEKAFDFYSIFGQ